MYIFPKTPLTVHTVQLNCKCGKVLFPHICNMFTYLLSFCPKVSGKSPNKTAFFCIRVWEDTIVL